MNKDVVISSLESMTTQLNESLQEAKDHLAQYADVREFASKKIGCLGKAIGKYGTVLKSLELGQRQDLDDWCKQNFADAELRSVVEDLTEAEDHWDAYLKGLDLKLQQELATPVKAGEVFNLDSDLVDVRTGSTLHCSHLVSQEHPATLFVLLRHFA